MLNSSDARRRALGTIFLGGALVMLVWGQTALEPALKGIDFLLYWTLCMGLTFLALMVGLLDLWIIRRRSREERKKMFRNSFTTSDSQESGDNAADQQTEE